MCLWGAAFILFVLMKDQFALLASPSGKMILFTVLVSVNVTLSAFTFRSLFTDKIFIEPLA